MCTSFTVKAALNSNWATNWDSSEIITSTNQFLTIFLPSFYKWLCLLVFFHSIYAHFHPWHLLISFYFDVCSKMCFPSTVHINKSQCCPVSLCAQSYTALCLSSPLHVALFIDNKINKPCRQRQMVWHMFPYLIRSSCHTHGPHKPTDIHTKPRAVFFGFLINL